MLRVVALVALSASLSGASATAHPPARAEIGVVRLESARLGLVGLSGPFTSRAAERPARLLVTTTLGAGFADISPPALPATRGMARVRVSTTVDEQLLAKARRLRSELADSALIDEALGALLARNRAGAIDAAYAAYDRSPLDKSGGWGDLASFRKTAGAS